MPAEKFTLPIDTGNTGPDIRQWERTIGADDVREYFWHNAHGETATVANVAGATSSTTLQAANQQRIGWTVFNDSDAILYVKFGTSASASSFTKRLAPNEFWVMPLPWAGIITGIWSAATGNARVTEVSP